MGNFERINQLHRIFKARRHPVSVKILAEELDCTEKTVRRAIDTLRDRYHAPIENIARKGWKYIQSNDSFELTSVWFSTKELIGLASLLSVVEDMESELLKEELAQITQRIEHLLSIQGLDTSLFKERIKIIPTLKHDLDHHILEQISQSLIHNTRLILNYKGYKKSPTQREISPIKLIYYQENWFLDAYCHLRENLRTFRLSRIINANSMSKTCKTVNKKEAKEHFEASYGIFAGSPKQTAKLRFYGEAAREAAMQQWHPEQTIEWSGDDYILSIPYNKDAELLRDILKYANNVEVLKPAALRKKVLNIASGVVHLYTGIRTRT